MANPLKAYGNRSAPGEVRLLDHPPAVPSGWVPVEELSANAKRAIRESLSIPDDADLEAAILARKGRTADGGFEQPTARRTYDQEELRELADALAPFLQRRWREDVRRQKAKTADAPE